MKYKIINKLNHLSSNNHIKAFTILTLLVVIACFIPQQALAGGKDAFSEVYTKLSGWVGGSAGKVITIIAIAIAGIMGALGFSGRHVAGALGVGLLLSLATTVIDMIFG